MIKLCGNRIYLAALEREHCRALAAEEEADFASPTDRYIPHSVEGADKWFEEILRDQGSRHVRLGVFLPDGQVIGDIGLQDIDWQDGKCSVGLGFARCEHRMQGYGTEAMALLVAYAFDNLGLHRLQASTLSPNVAAQRSLEKAGFTLEGRQRQAVRIGQAWADKLLYGLLATDRQPTKKD